MKKIALSLIALLCTVASIGQNLSDNSQDMNILLDPVQSIDTTDHSWKWGVDVTTFLRDAEFSLPYTRGYTATGFFLTPYVKHSLGDYAQLSLGVNLAGVAGYDGIHSWQPLVRLEYEPCDNLRLVMGTIYGNQSHGLYEPMLDRERYIYDHTEEGMQILVKPIQGERLGWKSDTWIHWEELLEPWQPKQERFTMGTSNTVTLIKADTADGFGITLPLSFLGSHRGGQFSSLDTCIQSLFNESVGIALHYNINNLDRHRSSRIEAAVPFFWYQDISPTPCLAYTSGWGVWPQLTFSSHFTTANKLQTNGKGKESTINLVAQAGYWHGHQYIAPRGSYLFQSVSWHKADFTAPERDMITAKLALERTFRQGVFAAGIDGEFYYDMKEKGLDLVFGVYLRMKLEK